MLIIDVGFEREAITRLARVGYENVIGFLDGGIYSFDSTLEIITNYSLKLQHIILIKPKIILLMLENQGSNLNGYINHSKHISLHDLTNNTSKLNKEDNFMIYCAGGYRSMIACSILASKGFKNLFSRADIQIIKENVSLVNSNLLENNL